VELEPGAGWPKEVAVGRELGPHCRAGENDPTKWPRAIVWSTIVNSHRN